MQSNSFFISRPQEPVSMLATIPSTAELDCPAFDDGGRRDVYPVGYIACSPWVLPHPFGWSPRAAGLISCINFDLGIPGPGSLCSMASQVQTDSDPLEMSCGLPR